MPTLKLPALPAPSVPLTLPLTSFAAGIAGAGGAGGTEQPSVIWNKVWYDYLRALDQCVRELQGHFP